VQLVNTIDALLESESSARLNVPAKSRLRKSLRAKKGKSPAK
jgi:hypothetical protein